MLTFFGTIIIVYLLWLVVKPLVAAWLRRRFTRKVNDMFRQAYGFNPTADDFDGESGPFSGYTRRGAPQRRSPRRKVYGRDEGEYVEFEDIEASPEYGSARRQSADAHTPAEPRISDAEWEDI